jgi:hypothetical protein
MLKRKMLNQKSSGGDDRGCVGELYTEPTHAAIEQQTALTVTSTYEKYFRVIFLHIIDYLWKIEFSE